MMGRYDFREKVLLMRYLFSMIIIGCLLGVGAPTCAQDIAKSDRLHNRAIKAYRHRDKRKAVKAMHRMQEAQEKGK